MGVLKNAKREKFVQCLISGMSQRRAYREAFPRAAQWKDKTVDSRASELFAYSEVLGRYQELQKESVDAAVIDRRERMTILSTIARDEKEKPESRIKAIDTINKMDGEYVNRVEVSGTLDAERSKLSSILEQLRGDGG